LGNERRRDLNDRDDTRDRVLLDAATDIEPAHIRELHIEQHEIGHQLAGLLQRVLPSAALHDLIARLPQNACLRVTRFDGIVAVYDQDLTARHTGYACKPLDARMARVRSELRSLFCTTACARRPRRARSSVVSLLAVTIATGTFCRSASFFSTLRTSSPLKSGNPRSRKINDGRARRAAMRPLRPSAASSTQVCVSARSFCMR